MKIIEIKDIEKKDLPLHYRNEFKGSLVYEDHQARKIQKPLSFVLERQPTGKIDISVTLLESIDYPLIPAIKSLKSYIMNMEKKGKLL